MDATQTANLVLLFSDTQGFTLEDELYAGRRRQTLQLFQRHDVGDISEMGWSACGLFK